MSSSKIGSWVFPVVCPACGEQTATPVSIVRAHQEVIVTIRCALCAHAWPQTADEPPDFVMPSARNPFEREVEARFGVLPNFFCSADAAPGLLAELWKFASSAYLDSPLPSHFKERLFVHLSRFCRIRYCIVRHVGFLMGHGRPAGDPTAPVETVQQVVEMLRRAIPDGLELHAAIGRLATRPSPDGLPAPGTQFESDLFDVLTLLFVSPVAAARVRSSIRTAVGDARYEILIAFLAFVRTAHYWTETHPELAFEADMVAMLSEHQELAALLLDASESDHVRSRMRLREALDHLYQLK